MIIITCNNNDTAYIYLQGLSDILTLKLFYLHTYLVLMLADN